MYVLRDYQKKASDSAVDFFNRPKYKSPGLIVVPTGGGKSLIVADIARRLNGKVLVFQPSKELLEQNYGKYVSYGEEASIYSASMGQKEISDVTFATIGSVKSIASQFAGYQIVVDECHLVPPTKGSMYTDFLNQINARMVGLTATPIRLKNYGFPVPHSKLCMLNRMKPRTFGEYIHVTQIKELVERGYFAPTEYFSIDFDSSNLRYNSTGSEFSEISVRKEIKEQGVNDKAVHYVEKALAKGRKHILIFAPLVEDAHYIADKLGVMAVSGDTPKKEREMILQRFKSGEMSAVTNVNVLTTGFDFPEIDMIVLARPTNSLALYYQMIGRGVRPSELKKNCVILDLVGNYDRFGRVEDLTIEDRNGWGIFSGDRVLTNVDMREEVLKKKVEAGEIKGPVMPWGKYKDLPLAAVPVSYLKWCTETWDRKSHNEFIFKYYEENCLIKSE